VRPHTRNALKSAKRNNEGKGVSSETFKKAFNEDDSLSWRKALERKLSELVNEQGADIEGAVKAKIKN